MTEHEALYQKEAAHLLDIEGGYVNDPTDRGGETYAGISRRHHPNWPGWEYIDAQIHPIGKGTRFHGINEMVLDFYRAEYWTPSGASELAPEHAREVFGQAVHSGVHRAVRTLQLALNVLNGNAERWPDTRPDGVWGNQTMAAYRACLEHGYAKELGYALDGYQCWHLLSIMENDHTQEAYAIGWLRRAREG